MYPNGNSQQPEIGFGTQGSPYPPQPGFLPSPGYPALPGYPAAAPSQTPGYSVAPGQTPGYPAIPGLPGYPGFPAAPVQTPGYPGFPAAPVQTPGYPGFPAAPVQTPGYPGIPAAPVQTPGYQPPGYPQAPGYPQLVSNYPVTHAAPSAYPSVYPGQTVPGGYPVQASYASVSGSGQQQYQDTPTIHDGPFDPTEDAKVLRKAMKGFGTDEAAIIKVLAKRTNNQRLEISQAFKSGYGKDLIKDLKSELSGRLKEVVLALMTPRYEFLAQKLNKAMSGIGTKEKTLVDILCTATNKEIQEINSAYSLLFNKSFESEVQGDTSGHFCRLLISVNTGARDENSVADPSLASQDAQALLRAGENKIGTDESTFNLIRARRSFPQLRLMLYEYERISGHSLEKAVKSEFSGDIEKGLLAVIKSARNRAAYFAERLHDSLAGAGTKDDDLIFIVVTRAEIDMENIKQEYNKLYHKSVAQAISGDTNGDYKKILLGLIGV